MIGLAHRDNMQKKTTATPEARRPAWDGRPESRLGAVDWDGVR